MSVTTSTKYAILSPADQTILYQIEDGSNTIDHKEAILWTSLWDAEIECDKLNNTFFERIVAPLDSYGLELEKVFKEDPRLYWRHLLNRCDGKWYMIEEVKDEVEFRSREDTW